MSDLGTRSTALDPRESFIVQAPAGSGKTELLIQRYLVLLATVDRPEQVVAITFTRKAAAEMRRRVQLALRDAAAGESGSHEHQRTTLRLARAVVERDTQLEWTLLDQPQRLRIDTLDAFNVWLAQQLPVLADGVAASLIVDKPEAFYLEAARRTVSTVAGLEPTLAAGLRTLLRSVDNDAEQLERLLAALLPRRDQWLPRLARAPASLLQAELEGALQRLVDDELERVADLFPDTELDELAPVLRHAASAANDGLRATLQPWLAVERPERAGPAALAAWRGVAALLLTKQGHWRKRITKAEGLGADRRELAERCRSVLERLASRDDLERALHTVASLPDARYSPQQWRSLEALRVVLVRLAAELKVAFAENRRVDFVELALAAQRALGQVDAPSELLLALDRRIQHLLVDEFQDTSQSQLRLLELLTAGWQTGDGRTLFLVGDPMQSIYRFRDADMSLFLRAKQRGVGTVALKSLTLQQNFRSAPPIVDWVNRVFAGVFPGDDELATGTAGFRASEATRHAAGEQFVRNESLTTDSLHAEAERVIEILAAERARSTNQSIAVLVQSRSHLGGLRERLRNQGWPVHAVEIDSLGEQQVAQDLTGLTRALVHLADRLAWLAVLRAPWCGLEWRDLHALCHDTQPQQTVWELIKTPARLAQLSEDGQRRATALAATLDTAFARRDGQSLSRWIEQTWLALDGPSCLDREADERSADQFFALLAGVERSGDLDDPIALHAVLAAVQPQADPPREAGIEIMTMHRAKGLEFDTVVLLGLGRELRPDEPRALQWMGRVAANGQDDLLMVPAATAGDEQAARLSDFVRRAERQRDLAERARLLYVATTRARERLYLVSKLATDQQKPPDGTMLASLWSVVGAQAATDSSERSMPANEAPAFTPVLRRLATPANAARSVEQASSAAALMRPEFVWAGQAAVHVGTLVHRYLQRIADKGIDTWSERTVDELKPTFERELALLGVERREVEDAAERVVAALSKALLDTTGRWVLGAHDEAQSELRLAVLSGDSIEHLRLDRTFVADGQRWIVDFKTSQHEGGNIAAFLDSEMARYAPQLERYARAMAAIDARPIRLGLYFPLLGEFRAWAASTAIQSG